MIDALATGGFGALAAVWLAFARGRPDAWGSHFIFALLFFFLFHVCREFSGYFTIPLFGSEQATQAEGKEQNFGKWPAVAIAVVVAIGFLYYGFTNRVTPDYSESAIPFFRNRSGWKVPFAIEFTRFRNHNCNW
jgi:hypothetical protein